ncbi:hypothetical protein [Streptomyces sp. URMC 123]|uniref:hypothetical protein n=1 Tax=Streptomyces sp. URMC 123 TaxID=3423403 RepID=UPI003F1ADA0C
MSATTTLAMTQLVPLAELDENKVTPGVLGFIVFAVIGGAVWLLMKSMNRQFGKINFEEAPEGATTGKGTSSVASGKGASGEGRAGAAADSARD